MSGRPDVMVGSILGQGITFYVTLWILRIGSQEKWEPNAVEAATFSKSMADSIWVIDPRNGVVVMGDFTVKKDG